MPQSSHLTLVAWLAHVRQIAKYGTPEDVQFAIAEMLEHATPQDRQRLRLALSKVLPQYSH